MGILDEIKKKEDRTQKALDLVIETLEALAAEPGSEEGIWGSMVKQTLKRPRPGFNESDDGFRSFYRLSKKRHPADTWTWNPTRISAAISSGASTRKNNREH